MTVSADIANPQHLTATTPQFRIVLLRMVPTSIAETGEAQLLAAVIVQAWADASTYTSARKFFTDTAGSLVRYCALLGLDAGQIAGMYQKHHKCHSEFEVEIG